MTTITNLPQTPLRSDPATFAGLADTYLAALPSYQAELNTIATEISEAATVSLASAGNRASYNSTSTSSFTFNVGATTATFVVQSSEAYVVGSRVLVYSGSNYIVGTVTDYTGTSLYLNILSESGVGTVSTWTVVIVLGASSGGSLTKASAASIDLTLCGGLTINITGNVTTTFLSLVGGAPVTLIAPEGWKLVHDPAGLSIAGLQDYTCSAGDRLTVMRDTSAGVQHVLISRQNGLPVPVRNLKAIFGYGNAGSYVSTTNLVTPTGAISTDVTGVGTVRFVLAAAAYGVDRAIFGYGTTGSYVSMTNLVSNTGAVSADVTGVGTARSYPAAAGYGGDKAIFGYGSNASHQSLTNLVSNVGVVASDTAGVGTPRYWLAAACYGLDKAIFGYGNGGTITNLVSNTGVVVADNAGVGSGRSGLAAATYGLDKALFGYGQGFSVTNLISNVGVVSADTTGIGTARFGIAAAGYGVDKAIFAYGYTTVAVNMSNLISNTGIASADITGVGTARFGCAAASYS